MQSMESCGGGARRGEAGGEDRMRPSLGDGQSWLRPDDLFFLDLFSNFLLLRSGRRMAVPTVAPGWGVLSVPLKTRP